MVAGFNLASDYAGEPGEIFILAGREPSTLENLANGIADTIDVPRPSLRLPKTLVWMGVTGLEYISKLTGMKAPFTRRSMKFYTGNTAFSINKAEKLRTVIETSVSTPENITCSFGVSDIYADDVAGPMLHAIHQIIALLGFPDEPFEQAIVGDSRELYTSPDTYYQRKRILPNTRVGRKWYTRGGVYPVFTSFFSHNHLISFAEYAAMYLGEKAYTMEPDDMVREWATKPWNHFGDASTARDTVRALFARRSLIAWRTYGISVQTHAEKRHYWEDRAWPDRAPTAGTVR